MEQIYIVVIIVISRQIKKASGTGIYQHKNIRIKLGSPGVFDRAAKHIISEKDNGK